MVPPKILATHSDEVDEPSTLGVLAQCSDNRFCGSHAIVSTRYDSLSQGGSSTCRLSLSCLPEQVVVFGLSFLGMEHHTCVHGPQNHYGWALGGEPADRGNTAAGTVAVCPCRLRQCCHYVLSWEPFQSRVEDFGDAEGQRQETPTASNEMMSSARSDGRRESIPIRSGSVMFARRLTET